MLNSATALTINSVIQPPEYTQGDITILDLLSEAYPEITITRQIGEGSFSKVFSFSHLSPEGEKMRSALKIINFWTATFAENHRCFRITYERIGGEWFSLLDDLGPLVLKTKHALAFDHHLVQFKLISAQDFQELFANNEREENLCLTLVGTVSEYFPTAIPLNRCREFSTAQIRRYSHQILQGVQAIHSIKIGPLQLIHRDIKPRNILLTPKGIKIFDFSLARLIHPLHKRRYTACGTLPNMAPEVLQGAEYDASIDLYSLATVLFYMATKRRVITAQDEAGYRLYHFQKPHLSNHLALAYIDPKLKDLIDKLSRPYSENRLTPEQALEHPFYQKTSGI